MKRNILVLQCHCGRIRRYGEWVFLTEELKTQLREELATREVEKLVIITDMCDVCAKKLAN